ncbi:MAG TPA: GNAT family N-acetyltransferase [Anaerolineales bacterium]|nr:GNAT family N-acetyltransferase [Anaerolineales bacterium]
MTKLDVRVYGSIQEIEPDVWDRIVAGRGFQSHRWYQFGERAMADATPTYLLAWDGDTPIASAALFKVHNEPLPLPAVARRFMASILKRRPLLVCRSPLADTSALLLPGEPLRDEALRVLAQTAYQEFKRQRCSFLIFDYLLTEQLRYPGWPAGFEPITVSEPGTYMPLEWESFEAYLKAGNKKDRQYYKNTLRDAEENGLVVTKHKTVPDVETALKLIQNVSIWHGSAPNPWMRGLLENFSMIEGTWLEIRKDDQLVGCGAVIRDNRFQLATALGLEDDVPSGYSLLLYAALQEAFEHNIRLVRFGGGAYDVKRRLGLHLEDTNHAMISIAGIKSRPAAKLASST